MANMKSFEKIIGYDEIKLELERILDSMKNFKQYNNLGIRTTRGLLLEGEPGVGKTSMAKAFIKESKRKTFTLRKTGSSEKFVKEIENTFKEAKKNVPSIVFLDDIDKFSNEDEYHENTAEFITIQSCIDDCSDVEVFVLATANTLDCLPSSLLREGRFDKRIRVENPTGKDAEKIIEYYLKNKKVDKDVSYKDLARFLGGRSCASLETVLNEAGMYAAYERRDCIVMDDFIRSFMRVVYKAPESLSKKELSSLKITAVHEAGHALIEELFYPGSVTVITAKKHTQSYTKGFTSYNRFIDWDDDDKEDSDEFESAKEIEHEIMTSLGGKAAVEVVFGLADVGCSDDLTEAMELSSLLVNKLAYNGFAYFGSLNGNNITETLLPQIRTMIQNYYNKTKELITNNREFLDKLSQAIYDKKTITFREIEEIRKNTEIKQVLQA